MLVLKCFGVLAILLSGALAAYTNARYEKQRLSVLDAWISLLVLLRGEIDCYLLPIDEILAKADPELIEGCMYAGNAPTPQRLLAASRIYLSTEAHRLLASFVREIGKGNREEQVRRCEYYRTGLLNIRERMAEELSSRLRVGYTLTLVSSLALAILFW